MQIFWQLFAPFKKSFRLQYTYFFFFYVLRVTYLFVNHKCMNCIKIYLFLLHKCTVVKKYILFYTYDIKYVSKIRFTRVHNFTCLELELRLCLSSKHPTHFRNIFFFFLDIFNTTFKIFVH